MAAQLIKQIVGEITFSEVLNNYENIKVNARTAESDGSITRMRCAIMHHVERDYLYDDVYIEDVDIKIIVDITVNTDELWQLYDEYRTEELLAMKDFSMEFVEIEQMTIKEVDSKIAAGFDPYTIYADKREKVFGINILDGVEIGMIPV